jgi:hypothetical protein
LPNEVFNACGGVLSCSRAIRRDREADRGMKLRRRREKALSLLRSLIPLYYSGGREGRKRGGRGEPGVVAPYMDVHVVRARQQIA